MVADWKMDVKVSSNGLVIKGFHWVTWEVSWEEQACMALRPSAGMGNGGAAVVAT